MIRRATALLPCLCIALLTLALATPAYPLAESKIGSWNIKVNGYFKNIVLYTEPMDFPLNVMMGVPDDPLMPLGKVQEREHWDNYSRARLRIIGRRGGEFAWELHYEMRGLATRPGQLFPGFIGTVGFDDQWLPLGLVVYDEPGYQISHTVDRAWFRWSPKWGEIVVGRQAITWTVGRLWYPTDLFGPFLPFDIDQDEKQGVDAASLTINLGTLDSIQVIYAPLERQEDARVGGRLKMSRWGFDFYAMGGYFSGDRVGGASVEHNLFGAVVRAEGAYFHPLEGKDRWSFIINGDIGLPHNVYLLVEYFHQSRGENSPNRYYESMPLYLEGKLYGLASDYVGVLANWQARALLKPGLMTIVNLNDGSVFLGPSVEWNPLEWLNLTVAANMFVGSTSDSEYSLFPNTYYAALKAYF